MGPKNGYDENNKQNSARRKEGEMLENIGFSFCKKVQ